MAAEQYLRELIDEKSRLDARSLHSIRLLDGEINRVRNDKGPMEYQRRRPYKEKVEKLNEKVMLPVEDYPKFNFVGKLIGPKGSTLKAIQSCTQTKISILGRGSTRDKEKEEELSESGDPKYEHFKEPLHLIIQIEAPKSEIHERLANALEEINKCMVPETNDKRQDQIQEISYRDDHLGGKLGAVGRGVPIIRVGIPPPGAIVLNDQSLRGGGNGVRGVGDGSRGRPY